ncbi:MAG TPA: LLM class flavin-dependent oxidoreductase [Acidimicrobiia bacterium]|nr:LLM class flavin-dependent oxidoreductase [Acidimicrobiia bacterium]
MEFSLMTEPHMGGTYVQQLNAARWAEAEGLVSFARCDHYLSSVDPTPAATDAFAVLAGLARETTDIRLCVLVTPITFRHPAVIAKNAATIDQMSEGRLDLGVGTGWMDLEHEAFGIPFPDWPERWDRFEEALDYLDAAFGDGRSSYSGKHYSLDAQVTPKPTGLRMIIGGSGKTRTPTLAGSRADEYNFFICSADEAAGKVTTMRNAAGGRTVEATVMGPAVVGRDDQTYRNRLSAAASKRGTSPDDLEQRWASAGIPIGTPSRVADTVAALEDAGVQRIYVQWLDLDDLDTMKDTVSIVRGD